MSENKEFLEIVQNLTARVGEIERRLNNLEGRKEMKNEEDYEDGTGKSAFM